MTTEKMPDEDALLIVRAAICVVGWKSIGPIDPRNLAMLAGQMTLAAGRAGETGATRFMLEPVLSWTVPAGWQRAFESAVETLVRRGELIRSDDGRVWPTDPDRQQQEDVPGIISWAKPD